jgi:hypothetical protein
MAGNGGGILDVIQCGIRVSQALHVKHPSFPKLIPDLVALAEDSMSTDEGRFEIHIHPRNYAARAFIGQIESYSGSADIFYDREQNVCWRRFVIVKEICHILYVPDSDDHLTSTPSEVEDLINKIMAGVEMGTVHHARDCDSYTKLMALEILLPHHQRGKVNAEMAAGKTIYDIAFMYRLPQQMVRLYLSQEYKELMDRRYKAMGIPV